MILPQGVRTVFSLHSQQSFKDNFENNSEAIISIMCVSERSILYEVIFSLMVSSLDGLSLKQFVGLVLKI